jgi:hypothetical protein
MEVRAIDAHAEIGTPRWIQRALSNLWEMCLAMSCKELHFATARGLVMEADVPTVRQFISVGSK